jgi:hypothetical protein
VGSEEAEARAALAPADPEDAATLDLAAARAQRDGLLEAISGLLLTGSVSWALALAARIGNDDASVASDRLGLLAALLRDASAASVDPSGAAVVHRERFADLARLGKVDASVLLDVAERALRLAADLDGSRLNVRLAAEAFALSL